VDWLRLYFAVVLIFYRRVDSKRTLMALSMEFFCFFFYAWVATLCFHLIPVQDSAFLFVLDVTELLEVVR